MNCWTLYRQAGSLSEVFVWAQIQLDGSVRRSGLGIPPWDKWLDDIPELDSLQTKLTDGIGMST